MDLEVLTKQAKQKLTTYLQQTEIQRQADTDRSRQEEVNRFRQLLESKIDPTVLNALGVEVIAQPVNSDARNGFKGVGILKLTDETGQAYDCKIRQTYTQWELCVPRLSTAPIDRSIDWENKSLHPGGLTQTEALLIHIDCWNETVTQLKEQQEEKRRQKEERQQEQERQRTIAEAERKERIAVSRERYLAAKAISDRILEEGDRQALPEFEFRPITIYHWRWCRGAICDGISNDFDYAEGYALTHELDEHGFVLLADLGQACKFDMQAHKPVITKLSFDNLDSVCEHFGKEYRHIKVTGAKVQQMQFDLLPDDYNLWTVGEGYEDTTMVFDLPFWISSLIGKPVIQEVVIAIDEAELGLIEAQVLAQNTNRKD